jgi:hypothetical protein
MARKERGIKLGKEGKAGHAGGKINKIRNDTLNKKKLGTGGEGRLVGDKEGKERRLGALKQRTKRRDTRIRKVVKDQRKYNKGMEWGLG